MSGSLNIYTNTTVDVLIIFSHGNVMKVPLELTPHFFILPSTSGYVMSLFQLTFFFRWGCGLVLTIADLVYSPGIGITFKCGPVQVYPLDTQGLGARKGPDKLDLTGSKSPSLDPPVPRGPVDLLRPGPEMRLNRHWYRHWTEYREFQ
ncbi:hypothetical protein TNCV_5066181 [Trichonephila clavipes]|nr:hypothetical protein TNCV_5066181 [Trichonephila clavipes]